MAKSTIMMSKAMPTLPPGGESAAAMDHRKQGGDVSFQGGHRAGVVRAFGTGVVRAGARLLRFQVHQHQSPAVIAALPPPPATNSRRNRRPMCYKNPPGADGKGGCPSSWLEGVPGAIGTSPERMVRNSGLRSRDVILIIHYFSTDFATQGRAPQHGWPSEPICRPQSVAEAHHLRKFGDTSREHRGLCQ
jgi:hypothetical protein